MIKSDVHLSGLARLQQTLANLERAELGHLLDALAFEGERLVIDRITTKKRNPYNNGPWQPWSKRTAKRRGSHHSLLVYSGNLRRSITGEAQGDTAVVGTNLRYADVQHQMRPFMGFSDGDVADLEATGFAWFASRAG